jgi:hypothetical protein
VTHFWARGRVTNITTEGGAEHIEVLAQRYTGGPYQWCGGRDQVRVILTITANSIHSIGPLIRRVDAGSLQPAPVRPIQEGPETVGWSRLRRFANETMDLSDRHFGSPSLTSRGLFCRHGERL